MHLKLFDKNSGKVNNLDSNLFVGYKTNIYKYF